MENTTEVTQFILLGLTKATNLRVPLTMMFILIYTINAIGNLGMILLILLDTRLHTPMYFFLSNLSLMDFCYSTAVTPTVIAGLLMGDKVLSYNACAAQMFFFAAFATGEVFILAAMAFDRYAAVCKPLHYTTIMTTGVFIFVSYIFIFITILKMRSSAGYQKALSTCASHFTAITIFYGTIMFMYLQPGSSHSMDTDKMASVFYTMVIPMLNPIVYSLRNKEVKNAIKKLEIMEPVPTAAQSFSSRLCALFPGWIIFHLKHTS
ncbi:PREDICTED: olfactory receptor 5B2-like [Condylura cristata]|uniref:olfactory receptor 5B2-like n=1 Tax=Condylura cristata TaxID=143302 RepID=UPI000643B458|nr:PREDICTED: olfactory receptor 5B2-like [Condylura cristata]